jgi:hypothetical protein
MRLRVLVACVAGAAFFAVLPAYALPILLQWEDLPPFLIGSGAGVIVGAALRLAGGPTWGTLLALSCALVGALVHVVANAIPTYGAGISWPEQVSVGGFTVIHMGVLAALGAVLAGWALAAAARLRGGWRGP